MASRMKVLEDNFPKFRGDENTNEKFRKVVDYLYIQKEQLGYVLEEIDALRSVLEGEVRNETA